MRLILVFITLWAANTSFGQFTYQGKLIDVNTNQVIEGVNVKINNEKRGEVSDKNGIFQLEIKRLPTTITISHIGYESEKLVIESETQEEVLIFLLPKVNVLSEVTVSEENEIQSISDVEKYSVRDFAILGDQVFRLEYHGVFKKCILSVTDVLGKEKSSLKLREIKKVKRLYKSCDQLLYLLSASHAYPLRNNENELSLGPKIQIDTFNRFIQTCKLKIDETYYYVNKRHNGLTSVISKYDITKKENTQLKIIANKQQVQGYEADRGLIELSQYITNIDQAEGVTTNTNVRDIQEEGDFLLQVFYKPEYPVYICQQEEKLIFLNHIEQKIEHYQEEDLELEVKADYVLDENWMKKVVIDPKTEKIYGVFDFRKGLGIKEINTKTGETKLVGIIETATQNYETIQIQEGLIFYLKEDQTNGAIMELVQQRI